MLISVSTSKVINLNDVRSVYNDGTGNLTIVFNDNSSTTVTDTGGTIWTKIQSLRA